MPARQTPVKMLLAATVQKPAASNPAAAAAAVAHLCLGCTACALDHNLPRDIQAQFRLLLPRGRDSQRPSLICVSHRWVRCDVDNPVQHAALGHAEAGDSCCRWRRLWGAAAGNSDVVLGVCHSTGGAQVIWLHPSHGNNLHKRAGPPTAARQQAGSQAGRGVTSGTASAADLHACIRGCVKVAGCVHRSLWHCAVLTPSSRVSKQPPRQCCAACSCVPHHSPGRHILCLWEVWRRQESQF